MKKSILIAALACICISASAQTLSVIEGVWETGTRPSVQLFEIKDGSLNAIAASNIGSDNRFAFAFYPSEGFYVIGTNPKSVASQATFYFTPGDNLSVTIADEGIVVHNGTPENKEMVRWNTFMKRMKEMSFNFDGSYVEFFPLLDRKLKELESYKQDYSKNKVFNEKFRDYQKYDVLFTAINFLVTPRSAHPSGEDFSEFYTNLDFTQYSSDKLLEYPFGLDLLRTYSMALPIFQYDKFTQEQIEALRGPISGMDIILSQITGPKSKGEFILTRTGALQSYDDYQDFKAKYEQYFVTDTQKERFLEDAKRLGANTSGKAATDFTFPDIDGNQVSLSDFKGKVVYIDAWATWCGPCIQEIPNLKKLEQEYHGKDVVFMSISIDKSKDEQKWRDFVVKEELSGVQLFGGDAADSSLSVPYSINTIPRFILIGKDGNLISENAPRPSNQGIRRMLDAALAK